MFADPLSIDFAGEKPFSRLPSSQANKSVYRYEDSTYNLEFNCTQSATAKRKRHEIRITQTKVAPDPISAVNQTISASAMIVIDEPNFGFTDAELGLGGLIGSLIDTLSDDSGLVAAKMLAGEI